MEKRSIRKHFPIGTLLSPPYLTTVHEIQQPSHVTGFNIGHQQDGMTGGILQEDLLKVWTANGQHQFVGLEDLSTGSNGHIHHFLILLQRMETSTHIAMEIVP